MQTIVTFSGATVHCYDIEVNEICVFLDLLINLVFQQFRSQRHHSIWLFVLTVHILPYSIHSIQVYLNIMIITTLNVQENLHKVSFPTLKRISLQTCGLYHSKNVIMVLILIKFTSFDFLLLVNVFHVIDWCYRIFLLII